MWYLQKKNWSAWSLCNGGVLTKKSRVGYHFFLSALPWNGIPPMNGVDSLISLLLSYLHSCFLHRCWCLPEFRFHVLQRLISTVTYYSCLACCWNFWRFIFVLPPSTYSSVQFFHASILAMQQGNHQESNSWSWQLMRQNPIPLKNT